MTATVKQERVATLEVQRDSLRAETMLAKERGDLDGLTELQNTLASTQERLERARSDADAEGEDEEVTCREPSR